MPLVGSGHSLSLIGDEAPYFTSLEELDSWMDKPSRKLRSVLPYTPRSKAASPPDGGPLLVCHDYKGGYNEKPSRLSYTFNFWSYCEIFIYFAHHRITIPPSGWITAAHRQGVKILGTVIFEGGGGSDVLRLLFGRVPNSPTGPASPEQTSNTFPVSPHYARALAELARQRGFDGYMLNMECPLQGGPEQTRALSAWLDLLRHYLKTEIGDHTEVIWYDSVIYTGDLAWQDRLNHYNLVFHHPSTRFFTNYSWPPVFPTLTAQYALDLTIPGKTVHDIYVGIDIWGRNQYGDGGLGTYRALEKIAPNDLGLGVALFAPAWTWETTEEKFDWTWHEWWKYERMLWLGPDDPTEIVPVPPMSEMSSKKQAINPEVPLPGPFCPIVHFFRNSSPPNPFDLPFVTFFSPGIGFRWFIDGKELMDSHDQGWTDIQKQTSLGNLIWPKPTPLLQEGGGGREQLSGSATLDFTDAWLGGSSLKVTLHFAGDDEAYFRHLFLPVQSVSIYPGQSYDALLIYKTEAPGLDLEAALTVRSSSAFELTNTTTVEFGNGWTELRVRFVLPKDRETAIQVRSLVGIIIGFTTEDPSQPRELPIKIGLLSVYPSPPQPPSKLVHHKPRVLWANCHENFLTWEISAYFDPIPGESLEPQPPDNTGLKWELSPAVTAYPRFMFFNVYIETLSTARFYRGPEHAVFIGTTGWDGRENRFYVEDTMLPEGLKTGSGVDVRFYVQGVTDRGEVLPWVHGVFVDAKL